VDLRAIEYFTAAAERRTLRGAAARLGISQPALTKAIRRLEDEVGVVLLDRPEKIRTPVPSRSRSRCLPLSGEHHLDAFGTIGLCACGPMVSSEDHDDRTG
jgi:hypothetical protein